MTKSTDGSKSLADQESAIGFQEAKGYEMTDLKPDTGSPPWNIATFNQLPAGEVPDDLHLAEDGTPTPGGVNVFWKGSMYIAGAVKPAFAYRG
jgi:hypothetical protein